MKKYKFMPNPEMRWDIYAKILSKVSIAKEENILDVGCGIGKLKRFLPFNEVEGVDFNKSALIKAKKRVI